MSLISYLCSPPYLWWMRAKAAINGDQVVCSAYTCVCWDAHTRPRTCTHTHAHSGLYSAVSSQAWFTELREGGQNPADGIDNKVSQRLKRAELEETSRGHPIHSLSLERPASHISLLGGVSVTSPWRYPVWGIVQLLLASMFPAALRPCMLGVHPWSCQWHKNHQSEPLWSSLVHLWW